MAYKNIPLLNDQGKVEFIIISVVDVTEQVVARKEIENLKFDKKVYDLFMQAPVAIGIVKGENYIIELANHTF